MTKSTSGGCGQFETSPETIAPELRTAFCERGQTDRRKTNYSVDNELLFKLIHSFQLIGQIIHKMLL